MRSKIFSFAHLKTHELAINAATDFLFALPKQILIKFTEHAQWNEILIVCIGKHFVWFVCIIFFSCFNWKSEKKPFLGFRFPCDSYVICILTENKAAISIRILSRFDFIDRSEDYRSFWQHYFAIGVHIANAIKRLPFLKTKTII